MKTWWDFALATGLLAGHAWLLVLSHCIAMMHRRLSRHICRDAIPVGRPQPARHRG